MVQFLHYPPRGQNSDMKPKTIPWVQSSAIQKEHEQKRRRGGGEKKKKRELLGSSAPVAQQLSHSESLSLSLSQHRNSTIITRSTGSRLCKVEYAAAQSTDVLMCMRSTNSCTNASIQIVDAAGNNLDEVQS
jgi:hypothetical protein